MMGTPRLPSKGGLSLAAYVRNHPFRTVEHCAVVLLTCILLRDYVASYTDDISSIVFSNNSSILHQAPLQTQQGDPHRRMVVLQLSTRDLVALAQLHALSEKILEPSKDVVKGPAPSLNHMGGQPGQV